MRTLLSFSLITGLLLTASVTNAAGGKTVDPFPFSEGEDGTPLEVVFELLKAGIEGDSAARNTYERYVLPGRRSSAKAAAALATKEWENLTAQAHNYLVNDIDVLKGWVQQMTPDPFEVKRSTKKVYVTLRNQMDNMRQGMFIVERDKKGNWKLRTLNL